MAPTEATARFFLSPYFALAGASQSRHKFGYKLLEWYSYQSLNITPINPATKSIRTSPSMEYSAIPSVSSLPVPSDTSLSIVTPPPVTKQILEEAKKAGIRRVWLQPGSFDDEGLEFAKREFETGIGGEGGRGGEGWCVLVDGEAGMRAAEKLRKQETEEKGKL